MRVPWIALGSAAAVAAALAAAPLLRAHPGLLPPCLLKSLTGLPCATCGLTRCVLALAEGRWAEAFHWHPLAFVALALLPAAAAWDLQRAWRGRPYPPLPDHWAPRLAVAALLLGAWMMQILRGM